MPFLIGPMHQHIDGRKELTAHNEILRPESARELRIALNHGNTEAKCLVEVDQEVKIGTKIAERSDFVYVPFFSPVSGKVVRIEKKPGVNLRPVTYVVIENDYQERTEELSTLSEDANKEEIIAFLKEKGIIGCGGAGFPTYFKYQTDKCETLLINAVECEPFITSDARMIEEHIDYLKLGVRMLFRASGAKVCRVCIKENKEELIRLLEETFRGEQGIEITRLKDLYPMGWERTLVYEVLHKRYEKLPIEAGAIISNATTAIYFGRAMKTGLPIDQKLITVSGDAVKEPHNVLAKVGTSFHDLIEACGGYTADQVKVLAGGPMMGFSVNKDEVTISPSSNAVTVLKYEKDDEIACLRCGTCADHCPSGLRPVNIMQAMKANDLTRIKLLKVSDCIECGLCSYNCPSKIAVTENMRRAKRLTALRK